MTDLRFEDFDVGRIRMVLDVELLPTHWGMTTAPLRSPVELTSGMVVRARVRTAPAQPAGTWTSWAIALPGADWEEHDEQAIWQEIDD